MKYDVVDTDPDMDYKPGEEVMASVEAGSPAEAIAKVMKGLGVDVLRAYGPAEYEAHVLKYVEAVEAMEGDLGNG